LTALLHDFDYEKWPNQEHHPNEGHPSSGVPILRQAGYPEEMIHAILGHADYTGVARESPLDHALFACDEMSGFLTACALVRPGKTIFEVEPASVKKRMKDKAFARGVSREDLVKGAEEMGIALEEHMANCIAAMCGIAEQLGLERKS
jgi:predicted hydrolase (HD superfamily)